MVGVLIRMRLRLQVHSLRGAARIIGFVVGVLLGLLMAAATAGAIAAVGLFTDSVTEVASLLFLVWTLGWLVVPVVTAGSDETLQPEHFSLLPVGPRKLALGLIAASAVGVAPVVTLLAFAGLLVPAASQGPATFAVAVVGVVLQVVLVITASRVVVGGLGSVMRSRRGRDLGVLLASGTGLLIIPAQLMLDSIGPVVLGFADSAVLGTLRWLPSGWAPAAVHAASQQQWSQAVGLLAALVLAVGLLTLSWSVLLRRRLTVPSTGSASKPGRAGSGGLERLLPPGRVNTVVVKEVRLWLRDNRRRVALLPTMLLGLAMPLFIGFGGAGSGSVPFAGLFVVWLCTVNCGNLYGFDGAALRHTLLVPEAGHADVRGKQAAWFGFVAPVAVLAALVAPAVTGETSTYPWVLGLTMAGLGAASGVVVLLSVLAPFRLPQQRTNPFSAGGRPGFATAVTQLAMSLLLVVAALPVLAVLVTGAVLGSGWLMWSSVPVGLATGVVSAWLFGRIAARRLAERGPELLETVRS